MRSPSLAEVITALERRYEPVSAADWDHVGLVVGEPAATVRRVLFAIDPVKATIEEALAIAADLLITHHPLFLRPVHGIPASTWKGALAHRLVTNGCALYTAHTNADVALPGVSDALAAKLGMDEVRPLTATGLGRIGLLRNPVSLHDFAALVRSVLPAGAGGIRVAGDPDRMIATIAICAGAGDDLFDAVQDSGVDLYLTSDLRHHPLSEAIEGGTFAIIDAGHFATEWPWLQPAAELLVSDLAASGTSVEVRVSTINTDAWSQV